MRLLAVCFLLVLVSVGLDPRPPSAVAAAPRGPVLVPERSVGAVTVRPDGAVVVAGRTGYCLGASEAARPCRDRRIYLAEFDRHGQFVRRFGGEWPSRWFGGVRAIALGPEGDVYLAGKSNSGARLAHFDRDGQRDPGFGAKGIVKFQVVGDRILPTFEALVITSDGGVIAAGTARTENGWQEVLLLRFEPDGSLDPGFGSGGVVLTPAAPGPRLGPSDAEAVTLMEDGRIVVAGSTEGLYRRRSALFAARYLSDGELDPSFGRRGQSAIAASETRRLYGEAVGVLPDGTVVLAGESSGRPFVVDGDCHRPVVARLRPDGSPDPGFGGSNGEDPGILDAGPRVSSHCGAAAATVLDDGGAAFTLFGEGGSSIFPGRLGPDGSRAPGFARPSSTTLVPPRSGFFWHFKLAPGGEVAAGEVATPFPGGSHQPFFRHSVVIVACRADGQLRRGFGTDGTVVFPPDAP